MAVELRLGKIENIFIGSIDGQLGVHYVFSGQGWGMTWSKAFWDPATTKVTQYTKWTEEVRDREFSEIMRHISELLVKAKKRKLEELVGIPIEVCVEGVLFRSWRILEEVL